VTPTEPGAAEEVERCERDLGAAAVGELGPVYGGFRAGDPRCFPVWEAARDLDVPLLIHAGPAQARWAHLKYGDLNAVDEIAIWFPSLRIVICHLGYNRYEDAAFIIAKHPTSMPTSRGCRSLRVSTAARCRATCLKSNTATIIWSIRCSTTLRRRLALPTSSFGERIFPRALR